MHSLGRLCATYGPPHHCIGHYEKHHQSSPLQGKTLEQVFAVSRCQELLSAREAIHSTEGSLHNFIKGSTTASRGPLETAARLRDQTEWWRLHDCCNPQDQRVGMATGVCPLWSSWIRSDASRSLVCLWCVVLLYPRSLFLGQAVQSDVWNWSCRRQGLNQSQVGLLADSGFFIGTHCAVLWFDSYLLTSPLCLPQAVQCAYCMFGRRLGRAWFPESIATMQCLLPIRQRARFWI